MNAVVLHIVRSAAVDSAARHDDDVGALSDVEVVVNLFFKSVFVQYYGYVHALVFRAGTNVNVYA